MEYALKLSNVCKEYDSSEFALDNVTFDLPNWYSYGALWEKMVQGKQQQSDVF